MSHVWKAKERQFSVMPHLFTECELLQAGRRVKILTVVTVLVDLSFPLSISLQNKAADFFSSSFSLSVSPLFDCNTNYYIHSKFSRDLSIVPYPVHINFNGKRENPTPAGNEPCCATTEKKKEGLTTTHGETKEAL